MPSPVASPPLERAAALLDELISAPALVGFITQRAYPELEGPREGESA